jgi:hypothetical protein
LKGWFLSFPPNKILRAKCLYSGLFFKSVGLGFKKRTRILALFLKLVIICRFNTIHSSDTLYPFIVEDLLSYRLKLRKWWPFSQNEVLSKN